MLTKIYKITYLVGLVPKKWLDVRVIFIPKVGKGKYNDPGSWRPISLMQYQMKGFEKILIWDNEARLGRPLHLNQHGFRKAKSTISSWTSLLGIIEHALRKKGFAIACFLDIKGAFDFVKNL